MRPVRRRLTASSTHRRYDQQYKAYQATEGYKEFVAAHPPEERGRKRKAGLEGGGGTPKSFKVRPVQFSHMSARE